MSFLTQYGWNPFFENNYSAHTLSESVGRICTVFGQRYQIITASGYLEGEVSGSLLNSKEAWDLPKVGDWVVFIATGDMGYIIDVLPRQNELSRKSPGRSMEKQVLATNIDQAWILQGLDRDFNLMRLQRYLYQICSLDISPLVILTKCDLVSNPEHYLEQVIQLGYTCPVILTSIQTGQGLEELRKLYLNVGKTYVLLGSSGVGKSSLLNTLMGTEIQLAGSVSTANSKGRHTTTTRNLILLPNGSLMLDTPGMREFGVTVDQETAAGLQHPQLEELALHCHFHDCTHQDEPGCAVREAIHTGELPLLVYQSYLKLTKESQRFNLSADERRRRNKLAGRLSREASMYRKRDKY
ncbi:ribosome small subunit-dependent GTPase A [Xanthocytophaga agilis]|uniref:Small ribosomal subunit biogenesis GTPase RsgA n=1 Tax=Xanthocytophaga agilis TaxID=3048010 RepID=A0AAE3R6Y9_9BACT|nr:ribosome small subunit-dependent GTPase A [Xanthocytophaga agilis]MDJ1502570.1 ribosome small subunit-dependent GTPase A [Xanthocytophaga agilis]